jgi:fucose permease
MNRPRFATAACYAAFLALGVCGTLLGPTFQSLTRQFGMKLEDAGIFTTLQFGGVTVAVVIAGRLLDRINARYLLAGGMALMGAGLILLGVAQVLPVALLGALLLGFGYGALDVSPNVVIATLNPDRASAALNALNVFYGVGAVAGPQMVNFALERNNFALAFFATAAFCLILIVPLWMVSIRIHPGDQPKPRVAIRWITLLPFALLLFAYVGGEVGFSSWIVTQVNKVTLAGAATATLAASIFWGGLTVGRAAASLVLRRLSDDLWLAVSALSLGAGVAFLLLVPRSETVALVSSFVAGFGCGPIFPTVIGMVNNNYPEARGTASGALIAVGTVGAAVVPWFQGKVGAGIDGGMIVVLAMSAIMFGTVVVIQRQIRIARLAS